MYRARVLLLVSSLALVLVACGGAPSASAERSEVSRTVTARLTDDMRIELSESEFAAGEVVRFEVTNEGAIRHEFYLGDEEAQEHHAEEMAAFR